MFLFFLSSPPHLSLPYMKLSSEIFFFLPFFSFSKRRKIKKAEQEI